MIECKNGLFHLKNENLSYLFRVNRYGLLEQLHFGAPVSSGDAEALACQPGLGWGSSLLLNDADSASCPDSIPLSWSGSGRGDFRESPMELNGAGTNFSYVNHRILEEHPESESGLPRSRGAREVLEITMAQPGARLNLYFVLFETALTRYTVLENTGDVPLTVHKLMSFSLDLPGSFEMTTFDGGWIREATRHTVPVTMSRVVNESTTGASSNRHNPQAFLQSEKTMAELVGSFEKLNEQFSVLYANIEGQTKNVNQIDYIFGDLSNRVSDMHGSSLENRDAVDGIADAMLEFSGNVGKIVENTQSI